MFLIKIIIAVTRYSTFHYYSICKCSPTCTPIASRMEGIYENVNPNKFPSNVTETTTPRKKSIRLSGAGFSSSLSPQISMLPSNRMSLASVNSDDSYVTATDCLDSTPMMNRRSLNVMSPNFSSLPRKSVFLNHCGMSLEHDLVERLERQLSQKEKDIDLLKIEYNTLQSSFHELSVARIADKDDLSTARFFCSLQEQKISELEHHVTSLTLQHNELVLNKAKKYKSVISKLKEERQQYEQRANSMVSELQAQMSQLQIFAMQRIEVIK